MKGENMPNIEIRDNNLWAKHIQGGAALRDRILSLKPGEVIELEVAGVVGAWEKTRVGKDGRTQEAVKPIGNMKKIWDRFQSRRGEVVEIREVRTADSYLAAVSDLLADEWNSPEDEEAFRDL
jgi:hypothetical protein